MLVTATIVLSPPSVGHVGASAPELALAMIAIAASLFATTAPCDGAMVVINPAVCATFAMLLTCGLVPA